MGNQRYKGSIQDIPRTDGHTQRHTTHYGHSQVDILGTDLRADLYTRRCLDLARLGYKRKTMIRILHSRLYSLHDKDKSEYIVRVDHHNRSDNLFHHTHFDNPSVHHNKIVNSSALQSRL